LYIKAIYIAFGEALGFMEMPPNSGNYFLMDVHGAGAQRSDPKQGNPENYPHGFGPQGDVIRIYNFVRLVRNAPVSDLNDTENIVPQNFKLEQNFPNPFNPTTTMKYVIPQFISAEGGNLNVVLKVYDVLGNEVEELVNEEKPAGNYEVIFDASRLSSGVYYYKLNAGNFVETKKMILLR
jgi:hypothetical protein